jgi:hypothetical protein
VVTPVRGVARKLILRRQKSKIAKAKNQKIQNFAKIENRKIRKSKSQNFLDF